MSFNFRWLLPLILIFLTTQGFAAKSVENVGQQIHEAYVIPNKGTVIIEAVPNEPPPRITEKIPPSPGKLEEWVPGYWSWDKKKGDFAWICGVWRKPPPGTVWNPGFWKKFDEGWVWIAGFWHTQPAQNISFIEKAPPAGIDENVQSPPNKNMFWAKGYWEYNRTRNSYTWRGGKWVTFDPKWVFNPATYVWRPQGYAFIPAFWDWPLEERGAAYCSILVDPGRGVVHTPTVILEPEFILECLFIYWPDYVGFYHHWWHFHPGFWDPWCCTPPWWGWGGGWWGMDPVYGWNVWWWWGNPGFPFPWWLTLALNAMFPPPPPGLFPLMGNASPPPFIGPNGMLRPDELIDAIREVTENDRPILPADPEIRDDIIDRVPPQPTDQGDLRPGGQPGGTPPPVPEMPPADVDSGPTQTVPAIPDEPTVTPPIQPVPSTPLPPRQPTFPPPTHYPPQQETPQPRWPQPQYTPPSYVPPQQTPEFRPPQRRPWRPPQRRPWRPPQYQPMRPPQQTPEFTPPSETHPPSYGPNQTPPPSQTPRWTPPLQRMQPQRVHPRFQPQQMQPRFQPPQQPPPQSTPQTELY